MLAYRRKYNCNGRKPKRAHNGRRQKQQMTIFGGNDLRNYSKELCAISNFISKSGTCAWGHSGQALRWPLAPLPSPMGIVRLHHLLPLYIHMYVHHVKMFTLLSTWRYHNQPVNKISVGNLSVRPSNYYTLASR